ncbi:MAG: LysR family transcriptional regulator [Clostridia bacterium]|nr:LysR family transcriptional regulator [Clostridia bacterium]
MNIKYYYNYVAIVESGSLTAASRKLRIAQPALSNQIKTLEQIYGTRLFYRGARRLELTDSGRVLYNKAKAIIEMENEAKNEIASSFAGVSGTLRIGVGHSEINPTLYRALGMFAKEYDGVDIRVTEATNDVLQRAMLTGEVEATFIRSTSEPGEHCEVVYQNRNRMVAAYLKGSEYEKAFKNKEAGAKELSEVPLVMINEGSAQLRTLIRRAGVNPHFRCICNNSTKTTLQAAADGVGVAIVPEGTIAEQGYTNLAYTPLEEKLAPMPTLWILTLKKKFRSPIVENFLKIYAKEIGIELTGIE